MLLFLPKCKVDTPDFVLVVPNLSFKCITENWQYDDLGNILHDDFEVSMIPPDLTPDAQ